MHPYYRSPVKFLLQLFSIIGLNPMKRTLLPLVLFDLLSIFATLVLIAMQFRYNVTTMKLFADTVESLSTTTHILIKLLTLLIKKNDIRELFRQMTRFWKVEQFDSKFQRECFGELELLGYLTKTYVGFCVPAILFFVCRPFLMDDLATICYVPQFIPRAVFAVYNSLLFANIAFAVVSFDTFACTMIVLLHLQYKLLNKRISLLKLDQVDERRCLHEMGRIVEYHNFLNGFLKKLNALINFTFFLHYIIYTGTMCFELYMLSKSSERLTEVVKCVIYIAGLSFEMLICFCIPSTILTTEASKNLRIIYESKWHDCRSKSIKQNILIIMANSQQEVALWAGNMFRVNLETCTEAFKKTLSVYACLKTIGEKN
ncbi:odorant receptor 4-like [Tenebrio molitor]|uniref:odorant receptor 4-like n=1 Tax=Tenebrio molitor TaxID=7067 RepID=UPI00362495BB